MENQEKKSKKEEKSENKSAHEKIRELQRQVKKLNPTDENESKEIVKIVRQIQRLAKSEKKYNEKKKRTKKLIDAGLVIMKGKKGEDLEKIKICIVFDMNGTTKKLEETVQLPFDFDEYISKKLGGLKIIKKYIEV